MLEMHLHDLIVLPDRNGLHPIGQAGDQDGAKLQHAINVFEHFLGGRRGAGQEHRATAVARFKVQVEFVKARGDGDLGSAD